MENEIFTPAELLEAWEHCMRPYGTGCGDCPNAIPGTENEDGVCECKKGLNEATMETLRAVIQAEENRKKEARRAAQARCIELMIKAVWIAAGEPYSQKTVEELRDKVMAAADKAD